MLMMGQGAIGYPSKNLKNFKRSIQEAVKHYSLSETQSDASVSVDMSFLYITS